jgi:hypothetical protein
MESSMETDSIPFSDERVPFYTPSLMLTIRTSREMASTNRKSALPSSNTGKYYNTNKKLVLTREKMLSISFYGAQHRDTGAIVLLAEMHVTGHRG